MAKKMEGKEHKRRKGSRRHANAQKTKEPVVATSATSSKLTTVISRGSASSNWLNFLTKARGSAPVLKTPSLSEETLQVVQKKNKEKKKKVSRVVAVDCEMVADEEGQDMLARVSVVDFNLICIYDKYVKPQRKVGDYRTRFSGIRPEDIENGEEFEVVQKEVKNLLENKIIVGHAIRHDFQVLQFGHHFKLIRDTSTFKPFKDLSDGKTPSLRKLSQHYLGESIQEGEHSSVQDATATMKLYKKYRKVWEKAILEKNVQNVSIATDIDQ